MQFRKQNGIPTPYPEAGYQDLREGESESIGTGLRQADSTETPTHITSSRETGVYPEWIAKQRKGEK